MSTLGGFVMSNLDATAREIEAWFFNDYVPTWVKAAVRKEGESFIFQYYSVPMYWNALGVNDWLTTEAAVSRVIDLQQGQLQDQHYHHTNVPDRRIVAYNENGGAVDVIWSRVRVDESCDGWAYAFNGVTQIMTVRRPASVARPGAP